MAKKYLKIFFVNVQNMAILLEGEELAKFNLFRVRIKNALLKKDPENIPITAGKPCECEFETIEKTKPPTNFVKIIIVKESSEPEVIEGEAFIAYQELFAEGERELHRQEQKEFGEIKHPRPKMVGKTVKITKLEVIEAYNNTDQST